VRRPYRFLRFRESLVQAPHPDILWTLPEPLLLGKLELALWARILRLGLCLKKVSLLRDPRTSRQPHPKLIARPQARRAAKGGPAGYVGPWASPRAGSLPQTRRLAD
jgi:hypothetical protein